MPLTMLLQVAALFEIDNVETRLAVYWYSSTISVSIGVSSSLSADAEKLAADNIATDRNSAKNLFILYTPPINKNRAEGRIVSILSITISDI